MAATRKEGPRVKALDYALGGRRGARGKLKNKTSAGGRRAESRGGKKGGKKGGKNGGRKKG